MNIFNRREMMRILGGGAGAMTGLKSVSAAKLTSFPRVPTVYVRENIVTFASNPAKLAALANGVAVMKQRSIKNPDDPTGWTYWASSHGTPDAAPPALANIYNQCKHGSPYFYPWHRAFLYYFEQTLRSASGDSTLNLPYWNWYSQPIIPAAFTAPANSSNPLWHLRESNTVGSLSQKPFARSNFKSPPAPGFSDDLEIDPHGAVHDYIGGDMGFIERSAFDPIFWLHHCNVDRLWNVWIKEGHANPPASDPWSNQSFTYNAAGTMTKNSGQVTNSIAMLGYKYDQEDNTMTPTPTMANLNFPWKFLLAAVLVAKPLPGQGQAEIGVQPEMQMMAQKSSSVVVSALTSGFALGSKSTEIKFPLSAENHSRMMTFAAESEPTRVQTLQSVDLVLEGVQIAPEGRRGGYSYRVCVAVPPRPVSSEALDRQCVGQFGSFEISVAEKHTREVGGGAAGGVTLRFPLNEAVKALGPHVFGENVPVTFVARHASLAAGQGDKTYVTVKSARLEFASPTR